MKARGDSLVRERSRVRFSLAAPFSKAIPILRRSAIGLSAHDCAEQRTNTRRCAHNLSHSGVLPAFTAVPA